MKNKFLSITKIVLSLATILCVIFGFKNHLYNTFENLFIDKCFSVFGSNSLSPFTAWTNFMAGVFLLYSLPYFFIELFGLENKRSNFYKWSFTTIRKCYVLVMIFVTFFMLPIGLLGGMPLNEVLNFCFWEGNFFHHLICPILFIALSLLEKNEVQSRKQCLFSMIPVGFYMIVYFIMVFIARQWEDFYYLNRILEVIGYLIFPLMIILIFGLSVLIAFVDNIVVKLISKREKKDEVNIS